MRKGEPQRKEYFEGILQLRNPSDELIDVAYNLISRYPDTRVAKEKKVRGGLDLYISNLRFLRRVGEKLSRRFIGMCKITATLHTQDKQTSKELYRVTALFRLASFSKGERFTVRGVEMEVIRIAANVVMQEVNSGRKHYIDFEEVEKAHARAALV